jgi:hypothetical protein
VSFATSTSRLLVCLQVTSVSLFRNQLHWHGLVWAGLPQWLTQRCAGAHSDLTDRVRAILDSAYQAFASPRLHAVRLLRRVDDRQSDVRAAFYSPPPPPNQDVLSAAALQSSNLALQQTLISRQGHAVTPALPLSPSPSPDANPVCVFADCIRQHGEAVMVTGNVHSHCLTCHKNVIGECQCRLDYPRATSNGSHPLSLSITAKRVFDDRNGYPVCHHFPEAHATGQPPHIALPSLHAAPQDRLHQRLRRLAAPGGDFRLLDYTLSRPAVRVSPSAVFPAAGSVGSPLLDLFERQRARLCDTFNALKIPVEPLPDCSDLRAVAGYISTMLERVYVTGDALSDLSQEHRLRDPDTAVLRDEEVIAAIRQLPEEQRRDFVDYLSLQNGLLGESNLAVSAALGCNFNAQPLVSTESALRAMFYILDYVTKDSFKPARMLSFVKAARTRCQRFVGSAPPGEDPNSEERQVRRLAVVTQNGATGTIEYASQQCVFNVFSLPAHTCSECFSYVFSNPAIRVLRQKFSSVDPGDAVDVDVSRGLCPRPVYRNITATSPVPVRAAATETCVNSPAVSMNSTDAMIARLYEREMRAESQAQDSGPDVYDPYAAHDTDRDEPRPRPAVGSLHRTAEGDMVIKSQDIDYLYRGDGFAFFGLAPYACCVRREATPRSRRSGSVAAFLAAATANVTPAAVASAPRGRRPNGIFPFDTSGPDLTAFEQHLASLQTVPIFGGLSSVPAWPPVNCDSAPADADAQMARFAEWVFAVLIPFPAPGGNHQYPDVENSMVERLDDLLADLELGRWRRTIGQSPDNLAVATDDSFLPPPGFDIEQLSVRRFNRIGSTMQPDFQSPNADFTAMEFWQQCLARWIGDLARGFRRPNSNARRVQRMWRSRTAQRWETEDAEKLLFPAEFLRNQARDYEARAREPAVTEAEMHDFSVDLLRAASNADEADVDGEGASNRMRAYLARIALSHGVIRGTAPPDQTLGDAAAVHFPRLREHAVSANRVASVLSALSLDSPPQHAAQTTDVLLPALRAMTPDAAAPVGLAAQALDGLRLRTTNAPNAGQDAVLDVMAAYFDAATTGRGGVAPLIFLEGAGGTGKSFLFSCVETLAAAVNRNIAVTALTGVACTAIPTDHAARTTHSCFKLGINPKKFKPIAGTTLAVVNGNLDNPLAVIIDEISFANTWILGAVDEYVSYYSTCQCSTTHLTIMPRPRAHS